MYARRMKSMAAAQRASERRKREDDAPRLRDTVPELVSLQIDVVEHSGTTTMKHKKHVVIAIAPALFWIACGDKECNEGGHEITGDIMNALRKKETQLKGEHACEGQVGAVPCTRTIQFEMAAAYRAADV
jgi:hypothetical protein